MDQTNRQREISHMLMPVCWQASRFGLSWDFLIVASFSLWPFVGFYNRQREISHMSMPVRWQVPRFGLSWDFISPVTFSAWFWHSVSSSAFSLFRRNSVENFSFAFHGCDFLEWQQYTTELIRKEKPQLAAITTRFHRAYTNGETSGGNNVNQIPPSFYEP